MHRTSRSIVRIGASLALLTCLIPLGGWGRKGHAVIAHIAYLGLTDEARERVDAIMAASDIAGATIQETASWADGVRGRDDEFPWTAPLHYANLPAGADAYDPEAAPEAGNVVTAVPLFARQLLSESSSDKQRKQALMFLVHFVSDLHQPLHAGNAEDRGGNDIEIQWFGRDRRLHSIWDSGIIDASTREPWPVLAMRLAGGIDDDERRAWTERDDFGPAGGLDEDRAAATLGRWVVESRSYADRFAYGSEGFNEGEPFATGDPLAQRYADHCMPVVELRLEQAGVRLAGLLNSLLGGETAAQAASAPVD